MRNNILAVVAVAVFAFAPNWGWAQATANKLPEPREVGIQTKDGVNLTATYYESNRGKEAVPILMLHAFEGSRVDYHDVALQLQKDGYAVLAPDLRGHGKSVQQGDRTLEFDKFRPADITAMARDLEACKNYLIQENNREKLNIDALVIVAAEQACILAVNYAALDWSFPTLPGGHKQGQDVKALVLLSPPWQYKSLSMVQALNHRSLQGPIAVYVLVGDRNRSALADAKKIMQQLEKGRRSDQDSNAIMLEVNTSLQGTKMLNLPGLDLTNKYLAKFIDIYTRQKNFPWKERHNPLSGK